MPIQVSVKVHPVVIVSQEVCSTRVCSTYTVATIIPRLRVSLVRLNGEVFTKVMLQPMLYACPHPVACTTSLSLSIASFHSTSMTVAAAVVCFSSFGRGAPHAGHGKRTYCSAALYSDLTSVRLTALLRPHDSCLRGRVLRGFATGIPHVDSISIVMHAGYRLAASECVEQQL